MINYLKWSATFVTIIGSGINALGYYPIGPIILILGSFNWLIVSILWKESSLIVTNSVILLISIICLSYKLF